MIQDIDIEDFYFDHSVVVILKTAGDNGVRDRKQGPATIQPDYRQRVAGSLDYTMADGVFRFLTGSSVRVPLSYHVTTSLSTIYEFDGDMVQT